MKTFQSFAVIPAAGQGRRLGGEKLLLPVGHQRLIEHTLTAWLESRIDRIVVVVRPDDTELIRICEQYALNVLVPPRVPEDMRDSICFGLNYVRQSFCPDASDAGLVAPADMPNLSPTVINALVENYDPSEPRVIVPTQNCQHGHPVLLPWNATDQLPDLPAGAGLNALVKSLDPLELEVADEGCFTDIDTPADYSRVAG